MNRIRRALNKSGMSLVEVIISVAIFSIIMLAAISMYAPVNSIFKDVKQDSDTQRVTTAADSYIARQVRESSEIWIIGPGTGTKMKPDWKDAAMAMRQFGEGKDERTDRQNVPQAIIAKEDANGRIRLYNIMLNDFRDANQKDFANPTTEFESLLTNPAELDKYRVMNESFYSDGKFEISIYISHKPSEQIRGAVNISVQVDVFDDSGKKDLDSVKGSVTPLTWIGNVHTQLDDNSATFQRARVLSENDIDIASGVDVAAGKGDPTNVVKGEFVILYNNNIRVKDLACCTYNPVTTPANCTTPGMRYFMGCNEIDRSNCPNNWSDIVLPALGHDWNDAHEPVLVPDIGNVNYDAITNPIKKGTGQYIRKCVFPGCGATKVEGPVPECDNCIWTKLHDANCLGPAVYYNECTICEGTGSGIYHSERSGPGTFNVGGVIIYDDDSGGCKPLNPGEPDKCQPCTRDGGCTKPFNTGIHKPEAGDCYKCQCKTVTFATPEHSHNSLNCEVCDNCSVPLGPDEHTRSATNCMKCDKCSVTGLAPNCCSECGSDDKDCTRRAMHCTVHRATEHKIHTPKANNCTECVGEAGSECKTKLLPSCHGSSCKAGAACTTPFAHCGAHPAE